jgi:hypothetical protein
MPKKRITLKERCAARDQCESAKAELLWATMNGLPLRERARRYKAAFWRHFRMIDDSYEQGSARKTYKYAGITWQRLGRERWQSPGKVSVYQCEFGLWYIHQPLGRLWPWGYGTAHEAMRAACDMPAIRHLVEAEKGEKHG